MEEIWKDIEGYEGLYQVSNLGRVKSLGRSFIGKSGRQYLVVEKLRKVSYADNGYLVVGLYRNSRGKTFYVHRLVSSAFLLNSENKGTVNHINGQKDDNRAENLEWATQAENIKHAIDNGLKDSIGERNGISKLTEQQVITIKYGLTGLDQQKIAEMYNVTQTTVSKIRTGRNWKHI